MIITSHCPVFLIIQNIINKIIPWWNRKNTRRMQHINQRTIWIFTSFDMIDFDDIINGKGWRWYKLIDSNHSICTSYKWICPWTCLSKNNIDRCSGIFVWDRTKNIRIWAGPLLCMHNSFIRLLTEGQLIYVFGFNYKTNLRYNTFEKIFEICFYFEVINFYWLRSKYKSDMIVVFSKFWFQHISIFFV